MVDDSLTSHEMESYSELMKISFVEDESQEEARSDTKAVSVKVNLNFLLKLQKKIVMNAWKNIKYKMIFPSLSSDLGKKSMTTNIKMTWI
jgi:hypothetical protein